MTNILYERAFDKDRKLFILGRFDEYRTDTIPMLDYLSKRVDMPRQFRRGGEVFVLTSRRLGARMEAGARKPAAGLWMLYVNKDGKGLWGTHDRAMSMRFDLNGHDKAAVESRIGGMGPMAYLSRSDAFHIHSIPKGAPVYEQREDGTFRLGAMWTGLEPATVESLAVRLGHIVRAGDHLADPFLAYVLLKHEPVLYDPLKDESDLDLSDIDL